MSSHHFVKEGQDPALLILDAPTFDVAAPLLEWAPLVVVGQAAVDHVLLWNIKIDVVLSKEIDEQDLRSKLASQMPLTILACKSEESPLANALYFLIRKKQNSVNIFSANVIDSIELAEPFVGQLQVNIIDGDLKWSAITSGKFEQWMAAGTKVFLKEGKGQQFLALKGLKKVDDHYECIVDGIASLESELLFWVGSVIR